MIKTLFVAGALALALPGAAVAQTTPPAAPDGAMQRDVPRGDMPRGGGGGWRGMMRADTNGDGMISKDEAMAQSAERFAALDTNQDGVLTPDEMTGPGARMLARADSDGDGKVTRAEYDAAALSRFARMDANGDGMVSADEIATTMERGRAGGPGRDPADAVGPPPHPTPGPTPAPSPDPGQ